MSITLFSIQYHWCCLRWMSQPLYSVHWRNMPRGLYRHFLVDFSPTTRLLHMSKLSFKGEDFDVLLLNSLWAPQIPLHSSLPEIHIFSFPIPIPTPNHNNLFAISETLANLQGYIWTEIQYALIQKLFLCICVRFASTFPNLIYFEIRCG